MSEYTMMVQNIPITAKMADMTPDQFSQQMAMGLGQILAKATKAVRNLPKGKKGEILSHCLTRIDRHLVLSLLIRLE